MAHARLTPAQRNAQNANAACKRADDGAHAVGALFTFAVTQ